MKEYKILSMDKAVIRKNSIRTEHLCNQLLSKPGTKLRLEAIQNVTMLHRAEKVAARVFAEHKRPNGARSMPDYVGRAPDARARFDTRKYVMDSHQPPQGQPRTIVGFHLDEQSGMGP
jgi:hypothetical protein